MIPFTYLCPRLLSSAFVRFWLFALPRLLISRFSFVRTPSVEKREGFFLPPKHSTEKFFRKFFQNYPRRLFADFLARICDEGKGCLLLAIGGGVPFFVGLWACCRSASFPLSLVPHLLRLFRLLPSLSLVPSFLVGFRSLVVGSIGAAGPVVFLVLLGGGGLPFLGPALIPSGA